MTDIVERLRQYESQLERESADEIERLRAECAEKDDLIAAYARDVEKAVAESVKAGIGEHSPEAAIATLRFQRDELRAELSVAHRQTRYLMRDQSAKHDEIQRLRAELDEQRSGLRAALSGNNPEKWIWLGNRELVRVLTECESMRAELDALRGQEPNEDLADVVSKALRRAWQLGQTYWQQADSEYFSQNKKADETEVKFQKLVDETRSAVLAPQPAIPDGWQPIETAPKDETFLAVLSCGGDQTICTMRWSVAAGKNSRPDSETFHVERVTHWMPLPAAPKPGDAE